MVIALIAGSIGAAINAVLIWLLTGVNLAISTLQLLPPMATMGLAFVSFAALIAMLVKKFSLVLLGVAYLVYHRRLATADQH